MFPVDFVLREYASNIFKQHLDEKVSSSDNNSKEEEEEEEEFRHSSKKDSLILCLVVPTLKISISSKEKVQHPRNQLTGA